MDTPRDRDEPGSSAWHRVGVTLLVLGLMLAPLSAVAGWARVALVDTDRFTATLAPLAEDPAVQQVIAQQVTTALEERVDVEAAVGAVFDGIRDLGVSPRASAALGLLEGPAVEGVRSLVGDTVTRAVESPAFATTWRVALEQSHARATALLQDGPDMLLAIHGDGSLSLQLGPVVEEVHERLLERGFEFAESLSDTGATSSWSRRESCATRSSATTSPSRSGPGCRGSRPR